MNQGQKAALVMTVCVSFLPVWRSGLRENMNFWQWIINHTVFGPPSEYVPEEYYHPDQVEERYA